MSLTDTTRFIRALRESAATVRAVAQTLRGAMETIKQANGGMMSPQRQLSAGSESAALKGGAPSSGRVLPAASVTAGLSGSFPRALQNMLRSVIGQLTRGIGAGVGGGIGGGLLSRLLGGGLSLLLGRLFGRSGGLFGGAGGRRLDAAATGPYELPALRNFPQLVLPGYASSPASALFSQRAAPRSPGINVTVEYKRGADDFVVAKVAQRLSELNGMENL